MIPFTSPFSPYTKTNYVPDERERHQILEFLAKPVAEAKRLEEEILTMEETLKAFLQQRQDLRDAIDQHGQLASAFRRVSDDVLREIFMHCLPSAHNALMSIHEPPFVLALVCKRWSLIVYETPRLWATIHIPLPTYPSQEVGETEEESSHIVSNFDERVVVHCNAIHTWISRSGVCPLSISFHPHVSYPIHVKTHLMPYLETLLGFASRWHTIELTILTGDFSSFFASIPAAALPMLDTLNITFVQQWQDWGQPHSLLWTKSGFINPPSLRRIGFYHFPFPPSSLEVDWSRLTRLDIPDPRVPWQEKGLSLKDTHSLLSHCQNLVHVSIDVEDAGDSVYLFLPIFLPHLESLDMLDAAVSLGTLLNVMSLPQLRIIRFQTLFKPTLRRRSTLNVLLSRTQPANIESLSTNLQMLTLEELMEVVQGTPNLTTLFHEASRRGPSDDQSLWLRGMLDFPVDFVAAAVGLLTPDADTERLWPSLTHIDLGKVRRLTDAAVLKFIEARLEMEGVTKLKSVRINFHRDMMEDIRPALGPYIEAGLNVEFVYPSLRVAIPGSIRPRKSIFKRNSMFRP